MPKRKNAPVDKEKESEILPVVETEIIASVNEPEYTEPVEVIEPGSLQPELENIELSIEKPAEEEQKPKKKKILKDYEIFAEQIPHTKMYETSFMHRERINFVLATKTDFIITASEDGHLKFWKKTETGIEFVKHFKSHLGSITGLVVSEDGLLMASCSKDDSTLKIYDVVNFDMIHMTLLKFVPDKMCFVYKKGNARALLAISEFNSPAIHFIDARDTKKTLYSTTQIHQHPLSAMSYQSEHDCVVSVDQRGFMEYWQPREPFQPPSTLKWSLKSETDLFELVKSSAVSPEQPAISLQISPNGSKIAIFSQKDQQLRIFKFITGKLLRKYDESLETISKMYQNEQLPVKLDDMEFGRRLAVENEIETNQQNSFCNLVFDESGHFVLYPTMVGIKVLNIETNSLVTVIGRGETNRFMNISLYQNSTQKKATISLAMAASDNPALQNASKTDPTLFCTGYKKNRFFLFTTREPNLKDPNLTRDIYNEKPTREEQSLNTQVKPATQKAILRTTFGDIHIQLLPEYAPKACENFIGLCKKKYYDKVIFHRVIKKFMIQTGDPNGNGTGGESIWGKEFEDEFVPELRHSQPFMVSMANAGPNTNGSQFFITTVATPWLDDKHTIFGKVIHGFDIVKAIEDTPTDRQDRPREEIQIVTIELK